MRQPLFGFYTAIYLLELLLLSEEREELLLLLLEEEELLLSEEPLDLETELPLLRDSLRLLPLELLVALLLLELLLGLLLLELLVVDRLVLELLLGLLLELLLLVRLSLFRLLRDSLEELGRDSRVEVLLLSELLRDSLERLGVTVVVRLVEGVALSLRASLLRLLSLRVLSLRLFPLRLSVLLFVPLPALRPPKSYVRPLLLRVPLSVARLLLLLLPALRFVSVPLRFVSELPRLLALNAGGAGRFFATFAGRAEVFERKATEPKSERRLL